MDTKKLVWVLLAAVLMCTTVLGAHAQSDAACDWAQISLVRVDEAGNNVYRYTLNEGMATDEGSPIVAQYYVCHLLMRSTPEWVAQETGSSLSDSILRVRLISDQVFEVTLAREASLPQDLRALEPDALGLSVQDDGEGAYLTGDVAHAIGQLSATYGTLNLPDWPVPLSAGDMEENRDAAPKEEAPKEEAPKVEAPKEETPKEEAPQEEAPKEEQDAQPDSPDEADAKEQGSEQADQADMSAAQPGGEDVAQPVGDEAQTDAPSPIEDRNATINYRVEDPDADPKVVVLSCKLTGFDGVDVAYQWQVDKGDGWKDVPGATGKEHKYEFNEETAKYQWRIKVLGQ